MITTDYLYRCRERIERAAPKMENKYYTHDNILYIINILIKKSEEHDMIMLKDKDPYRFNILTEACTKGCDKIDYLDYLEL